VFQTSEEQIKALTISSFSTPDFYAVGNKTTPQASRSSTNQRGPARYDDIANSRIFYLTFDLLDANVDLNVVVIHRLVLTCFQGENDFVECD